MAQNRTYTSLKKVKWVGKDQFIIHKRELLESEAWRGMSINCFKLINFLETRYLQNAGEDNGYYVATYNQLIQYGMRIHAIKGAVQEAEKRGLVRSVLSDDVCRYGKYTYLFRLTYLPQTVKKEDGSRYYLAPSDDWKRVKNN